MVKGVILAGGLRKGLLPLMRHTPISLLPIGNIPLLLFQIEQFKRARINEVILCLAHPPRQIQALLGDGHEFGVTLRYVVEQRPAGTAGALSNVEHLLDDTTVVLNGDVLTQVPIANMLRFHRVHKGLISMATVSVANPRAFGLVETLKDCRVFAFKEKPRRGILEADTINAGIYVLDPDLLTLIPRTEAPVSLEKDLFPLLLNKQTPFYASHYEAYWMDLTRPDNYLRSNLDLLDKKLGSPHFAALQKQAGEWPTAKGVDQTSVVGKNCIIKSGARIERSVLGANCLIEEGAHIRNSVLWPGCRIQETARISGAILGRSCLIGSGARVRRATILGDKSSVASYSKL